jgi:hypothetical protein
VEWQSVQMAARWTRPAGPHSASSRNASGGHGLLLVVLIRGDRHHRFTLVSVVIARSYLTGSRIVARAASIDVLIVDGRSMKFERLLF